MLAFEAMAAISCLPSRRSAVNGVTNCLRCLPNAGKYADASMFGSHAEKCRRRHAVHEQSLISRRFDPDTRRQQ